MDVAQSGTYSEVFGPITDSAGAIVTNAVSANDLTLVALVDSANADQSTGATFAYAGGGMYRISKTLSGSAALGSWGVSILWDNGVDPVQRFGGSFVVITAAADPAALATAIAGVQTTVDTIDGNVDVAVSTRATPGSYITTGSATATSGAATVYQGDDQVAVASRSLDWSSTTADQWPDLTGATILLSGQYRANAAHTVSAAGLVITPTGATKHVRVELSAAQTEALHDGVYEIQVIATTSDGDVVTLVETTMTVKPRKGP